MIDTNRLDAMLRHSLFREDELSVIEGERVPPPDAVIVDGIITRVGFHPQRLESHRAEVQAMLDEIGFEFHSSSGGGWSFLNLCNDKNGNQWGEHRNMEQLCMLSIGLKLAKWMTPRDTWDVFPGGMPYFMIIDNIEDVLDELREEQEREANG